MTDSKPIWASKTLWVNVIALGAAALNGAAGGVEVSSEETASVLVVLNLIMRAVTKGAVTLK